MRKWLPYLFVALTSIILIFFKFNLIPIHIAPDEIAFVRLVLQLQKIPYTTYTMLETGHATLYFYLLSLSFKIFGMTLFALRFPAALFGVLSAIIFYKILRQLADQNDKKEKWLPYIVIFIFITSRWYLTFARFSFEATFLLFLELVSLLFFFKYITSKKQNFLILSGIFTGLAFHSYTPGRIFFLVPLIMLPALIWNKKNRGFKARQPRGLLMTFLIPFILITVPLVIQITKVGDYRVNDELILMDRDINTVTKIEYVGQNVVTNISMLFYKGDMNGRHNYPGKPALNPISGLFFIIGIITMARSKKKTVYDYTFLIYFFVSLIPTILTHPKGNPNMLRTYTMLPSIMYFIGKGIVMCYEKTSFWLASPLKAMRRGAQNLFTKRIVKLIPLCIFLLICLSSLYELRTYFIYQAKVAFYAFEVKKPFEWVKARNFQLVDDWYKP